MSPANAGLPIMVIFSSLLRNEHWVQCVILYCVPSLCQVPGSSNMRWLKLGSSTVHKFPLSRWKYEVGIMEWTRHSMVHGQKFPNGWPLWLVYTDKWVLVVEIKLPICHCWVDSVRGTPAPDAPASAFPALPAFPALLALLDISPASAPDIPPANPPDNSPSARSRWHVLCDQAHDYCRYLQTRATG
jgi:hypothetical protein